MQNIKEFNRGVVTVDPKNKTATTVILLHGLGADASDLSSMSMYLQSSQENIRFVFPNAPILPVSLNGGVKMPAWFDILGLTEDSEQDEQGIHQAKIFIEALVDHEHSRGIPCERIFLGGFSQGGALALYAGLHSAKKMGGVIGLSTYLPIADKWSPTHTISVYMAHGKVDPLVPLAWGKMAADHLRNCGCDVTWREYPIAHTICEEELLHLKQWLEERLNQNTGCL
ncbi:MAG: hypothetical protein A3I12_07280 [Gammaproteobacteria bacterium RIFCSPLOWO2_02_FULL_38_11]|nr:MAG: hypothetical protein A3B69_03890 [Gammaproteobacteria bacterium RIFCSPHIGHO2_02_FULL_38_33]OGT23869.1 MAG: hypothetical protein A2W47_05005 [Gammaproteobacteria bacterium RIFCSPHIGHO2_12_38_15]OGT69123.1 MAG: hypothetical protein A3I12_07280 [Gammaproteobacteria bacterium RIFCSPLOWO2_02_FULL_38_11]OGT77718.1 MAG: hypothetical protein A3G71_07100 [Gammaproteobacteria bacterium RIFCSPLOWO2_12_FULL_38_14]